MSTVFLLGAGASYKSMCAPHNPALGNGDYGLFKAIIEFCPDGYFSNIQKNKPELADLFIHDFEEGMEELRNDKALWETGDDLREMARYFIQFQPLENNLYLKLLQILGKKLLHCTFVTTNYDLLIELAAKNLNFLFEYNTVLSTKNNKIKILKLHGSPNIWPDTGGVILENNRFKGCRSNVVAKVKCIMDLNEINKLCLEKNPGPVLAEYRRGKRVANCSHFTNKQISLWQKSIKNASRCFVVGLRLNKADTHIWEPLKTAKCVYYYSPDDSSIDEVCSWKKDNHCQIFPIKIDFAHALNDIRKKFK